MAHFAQLDDNNIVINVIVVSNQQLIGEDGLEHEYLGVKYCEELLGGRWVQTSYNDRIRKNYAGIGFAYDASRDAFIPPQPFNSWLLNEETCRWDAPSPRPEDGRAYNWDESSLSWVEADWGQ